MATPYQLPRDPAELQKLLAAPSLEEIEFTLRNHSVRGYKVDIETSSTVMGNVQENQAQMNSFLQGASAFAQAAPALVQQGMDPAVLLDIFAGFSRNYRLGKAAEDGLDQLAARARQNSGQQKPPSPEQQKVVLAQQQAAQEMALAREQAQIEAAKTQQTMAIERERHQFAMQEKMADARIAMAEKGLASRGVGADGQEEFASHEDVRVERQNAVLQQMADQQAELTRANLRVMSELAGALAQLGTAMGELARDMRMNTAARTAPSSYEIERDPDGKMAVVHTKVH